MFKKKLLTIHLNEFNYDFLKSGAKKYQCNSIQKLLNFQKLETYTIDKIQDKNLDPWVQTVSINTGISSSKHKIYKTGQYIPKKIIQIWDVLAKKKISSAIWGTMNTNFKNSSFIKVFFPDPWNRQTIVKPKNLESAYRLPRSYAENYTDFKILKNLNKIFEFMYICFKFISIFNLLKIFKIFIQTFLSRGFKNYNLFFLFDLISIYIFESIVKNKHTSYNHIFLNSIAHFQHNNWDEIENYKIFFKYTDAICEKILGLSKHYNQVLIYNGFTQKKIKTEYLLRPINPKEFLKNIGINFFKLNTNMTNGGILEFKNDKLKFDNIKKLEKFNIYGHKFFEIKKLKNNKVFFRIQVKSQCKLTSRNSDYYVQKNLSYDSKFQIKKLKEKNLNKEIFDNIRFLKTTGKHNFNGKLLSKKKLKYKNIIENRKIFKIIEEYFLI